MRRLYWLTPIIVLVLIPILLSCDAVTIVDETSQRTIAFIRDPNNGGDIWLRSLDSGVEALVTSGAADMDWHAGEEHFVVTGLLDQQPTIWTTNVAASEQSIIITSEEWVGHNPHWSPNGKQFVYETLPLDEDHGLSQAYMASIDTSQPQLLLPETPSSLNATWSPDGTYIIAEDATNQELILLNSNGSLNRRLGLLGTYDWSPDSSKIVVGKWNLANQATFSQLVVLDLTTDSETILIDDPQADHFSPSWSRDGNTIAFVHRPLGSLFGDVWTLDLQSGNTIQYTNDPNYDNFDLQWSQDSSELIWTRTQPDTQTRYSIWLLNLADSTIEQVAENAWKAHWIWQN